MIVDFRGNVISQHTDASEWFVMGTIDVEALRRGRSQIFMNYIAQLRLETYAQCFQGHTFFPPHAFPERNKQNQIIVPNIQPTGDALTQLAKYLTPYQVGANNDIYLIKTDWNISQKDRVSVRLNFSRYTGTNFENNGLTSALEHTGDNQINTNNVAASLTHIFGPSLVWDSRFNYVGDLEPGQANSANVETVIINGVTFGRNNFSPRLKSGLLNTSGGR